MNAGRLVVIFAFLCLGVAALPAAPRDEDAVFFQEKIRPVLIKQCYECHSDQTDEPEAGLRLDTREELLKGGDSGPAIVPGKPDASLLIRVIEHASEIAMMPPKGKLPDAVIADFRTWVAEGAVMPRDP